MIHWFTYIWWHVDLELFFSDWTGILRFVCFFFFLKEKEYIPLPGNTHILVGYVIQELGINLICGMLKKLQVNWFETDILQPWETLIYYFCSKAWLRFPLLVPPAEINPTFLLHYFQRNILLMSFVRLFPVLFVII